ncbi:MAG TPA: pseudouridine synthase [Nitrospirota bacterium]|nr:pseudouridine synthase [Nitrospirota bacterium]
MEERIQKIISAAGVTSRRAAEQLITEGRVRVNGKVVTELGTKADASKDHIKVDGKLINPQQPPTYIMLNKPAGFVTTMSDPEGRPTVEHLLKGVKVRVYPVGRLDYNTEGLLLLTNDGDFAHLITHPKHEFPKTYLAKVKGVLEDGMIDMLERGVFLQDGKTAPAKIRKVRKEEANSWVEITIHEGRKRQVRRMFDHVGRSVIKLKRIKTGTLSLGDLPEGKFRHLTLDEVNALRETAMKTDESGQQVRVYKPVVKAAKTEEDAKPRPAIAARTGRPGTRVMQDTREGLRKNQRARPGQGVRPRQSEAGRSEHREVSTTRESLGRRPENRKPAFGGSRSSWTGRKPMPAERRERTTAPGPRTGRTYGASTRPISSRPAAGRPATGAGTWKSESRSRPGQGFNSRGPERGTSFEGRRQSFGPRPNKSTYTGGKGPARGMSNEGRRPSSGPRANKSTYPGSKGPARGARPGSKGRGQGASNRGPRR